MSGTALLVMILALLTLLVGLGVTYNAFKHRAKDPEHRRRLGDRIRPPRT